MARLGLGLVVLAGLTGFFANTATAQFNTIALAGTTGTNLGLGPNLGVGVNFSSNFGSALNNSGQVAFFATLAGTGVDSTNDRGLFTNVGGSVAAVAREGAGGPGPNLGVGVNFSDFDVPLFNNAGQIAFHGVLTGSGVNSTNNIGIFTNVGGSVAAVARLGDTGPGPNLGPGVNFSSLTNTRFNNAGKVAFQGFVMGTGVDSTNNHGLFTNVGGSVTAVARIGAAGPGPNLGVGVSFNDFSVPVLNNTGRVAFLGLLSGPGLDSTNNGGIFTNVGGSMAAVARNVAAGPGPDLGIGVHFQSFNNPVLNDAGQVVFSAILTGTGVNGTNNRALFKHVGGSMTTVARSGSAGPGPNLGTGVNFGSFYSDPVLNNDGQVAFQAFLTGSGVNSTNDFGIFTNFGGGVAVVARTGAPGPGPNLGPGVNFGGFSELAFNNAGQVALLAELSGTGVNSTNNLGIFTNVGGSLSVVVRSGELFDVDPGAGVDLRTVESIFFRPRRGLSFNDAGLLTFGLVFSDGTTGVFTAVVPEPAGLGLFGTVAIGLVAWRRRHRCG